MHPILHPATNRPPTLPFQASTMASPRHLLKLSGALLLLCVGVCVARNSDFSIVGYSEEDLSSNDRLVELFEKWLAKHQKAYASFEEKLHKFEVFKDNLKHIDKINREVTSYWLGLNEFADLTNDEFKAAYLGLNAAPARRGSSRSFRYEDVSASDLPKSVDWRKKGAVTEVKNQGQCGSCWAFSTVAAVEGINAIVTGNLTALSEQELIDCSVDGNSGCNGGLMDYAFSYIASSGGLHTEEAYPYLMEEGSCGDGKKAESEAVTISGFEDVPANDGQALIKALAHQPVSVAIEASGRHFQFYSGGVFDGPCGAQLDHGVAAVGYGSDKGKGHDYIIVRNSWGADWGEKGYIRMKRGTSNGEGLCGINKMASYPTKDK
ncbi:cysteine protease XCP1-like [Triticum dicoccoides]|nr:cysteine protease XCP1-like [Triticum dicoccoides]XP_044387978.1 cysteine protease XCP1-like [Triticum aestivum]